MTYKTPSDMKKHCKTTEHQTAIFLPAGHARRVRPAGPKITLPFPHLYICSSVRPHLSRAQ